MASSKIKTSPAFIEKLLGPILLALRSNRPSSSSASASCKCKVPNSNNSFSPALLDSESVPSRTKSSPEFDELASVPSKTILSY